MSRCNHLKIRGMLNLHQLRRPNLTDVFVLMLNILVQCSGQALFQDPTQLETQPMEMELPNQVGVSEVIVSSRFISKSWNSLILKRYTKLYWMM